jgi:hypothetical protein
MKHGSLVLSIAALVAVLALPAAWSQAPAELRAEVEETLLRRVNIGGPTHLEWLRDLAQRRELSAEQMQNVLLDIVQAGLGATADDRRGRLLLGFAVDTLRHYPGAKAAPVLRRVVAQAGTETGTKWGALTALVWGADEDLTEVVRGLLSEKGLLDDLDRYTVLQALVARLSGASDPPAGSRSQAPDVKAFLAEYVQSEPSTDTVIEVDRYLRNADPDYAGSAARRTLLERGATSTVPAHKEYFAGELQAFKGGGVPR